MKKDYLKIISSDRIKYNTTTAYLFNCVLPDPSSVVLENSWVMHTFSCPVSGAYFTAPVSSFTFHSSYFFLKVFSYRVSLSHVPDTWTLLLSSASHCNLFIHYLYFTTCHFWLQNGASYSWTKCTNSNNTTHCEQHKGVPLCCSHHRYSALAFRIFYPLFSLLIVCVPWKSREVSYGAFSIILIQKAIEKDPLTVPLSSIDHRFCILVCELQPVVSHLRINHSEVMFTSFTWISLSLTAQYQS